MLYSMSDLFCIFFQGTLVTKHAVVERNKAFIIGYNKQTQKTHLQCKLLLDIFLVAPTRTSAWFLASTLIASSFAQAVPRSADCSKCTTMINWIFQNTPAQMASWIRNLIFMLHHAPHTFKTAYTLNCIQCESCLWIHSAATPSTSINHQKHSYNPTHTQDIHRNNMQHESKAFGKPSTHIFLHQWLIYTCLKCAINLPSKCNSNCAWIGQATFHISSMWV